MMIPGAGRMGLFRSRAAGGGGAPALAEISSTKFNIDVFADPIDSTVDIQSGSDRLLLDFLGVANNDPSPYTDVLDPTGDNIALTQDANSPARFQTSGEWIILHTLAEADFPATTGNKTLRFNPAASKAGRRRVVLLTNASQTIFTAANTADASPTTLTVTVNHPIDTFAEGSLVYAACHVESGAGDCTVTGDATEIDDEANVGSSDIWVFAKGTLGAGEASASATFTMATPGTRRIQAIIVVVEPA